MRNNKCMHPKCEKKQNTHFFIKTAPSDNSCSASLEGNFCREHAEEVWPEYVEFFKTFGGVKKEFRK